MSAIDTGVSIFQNGGGTKPWLFFTEIYGGTISYIESILKLRRGIDIRYFTSAGSTYDLDEFERILKELKPEFVYIETVSNPMLIVADVPGITKRAKQNGAKVIIDNTFATPLLFKPLDEGADLVIHSATKYFSGHGNLSAGIICGNDHKLMKAAIEYRKFVGHMISPDDAYRLQTQVLSFNLRFSRQCENAAKLAKYLSMIPEIKTVLFPGLVNHPTHDIAKMIFGNKGYGAMITFDFDGSNDEKRERRDKFINLISEKVKLIPTLGDACTILMPVEAVWGEKYPEPGMVRMSIGFEEYDELENAVAKAIAGSV
jgi:cystathionine beta-lyase/cystathionine gamma-synthase